MKPCSISLGISGYLRGLSQLVRLSCPRIILCVILHRPNPKTTHIYGDCILDSNSNYSSSFSENEMKELDIFTSYSLSGFLSFCYSCHKKLEEGKDIYIYRGGESLL